LITHFKQRLPFIDALRGFAALYVVTFHVFRIGKLTLPDWLTPIMSLGYSGVTLFFIISAFTLCLTLDGRTREPNWLLKFYFRRGARILPLYYTWLVAMMLWVWGLHIFHFYVISLAFFLYNFQPGRQEGLVWASWTLGVEMVFYLFFPFLFKFAGNLWRSIVLFVCSLLIAGIHDYLTRNIKGYVIEISLFYQLPVFCLGIVTYRLYKKFTLQKVGPVLLIAFLAIFLFVAFGKPAFPIYFLGCAYSLLLLGLSVIPLIANKVTVFLGKISYSLYLNHPMLVGFMATYFSLITLNPLAKFIVCVVATLVPLVSISYLTYRFIEKPGGALVKKIGAQVVARFGKPKFDTLSE
jgi:peptidoglycan/LPS O-acetylase OafA/YrhL